MNRDDIIRMARGAGFLTLLVDETVDSVVGVYPGMNDEISDRLERFAALVAAHEREACCKIVYGQCESDNVAQRTVDAIRARGEA